MQAGHPGQLHSQLGAHAADAAVGAAADAAVDAAGSEVDNGGAWQSQPGAYHEHHAAAEPFAVDADVAVAELVAGAVAVTCSVAVRRVAPVAAAAAEAAGQIAAPPPAAGGSVVAGSSG